MVSAALAEGDAGAIAGGAGGCLRKEVSNTGLGCRFRDRSNNSQQEWIFGFNGCLDSSSQL
jgi:hypothetical protein